MDPLPSINNVYSLVVHEESNNVMFLASISLIEYNIFINASNARKYQHCGKGTTNGGANENGSR